MQFSISFLVAKFTDLFIFELNRCALGIEKKYYGLFLANNTNIYIIFFFQVHCLQFLIYEVVSGGNLRKPGGLFGNSGSEIPVNDLKQLETFFYKLSFFLHVLDYTG